MKRFIFSIFSLILLILPILIVTPARAAVPPEYAELASPMQNLAKYCNGGLEGGDNAGSGNGGSETTGASAAQGMASAGWFNYCVVGTATTSITGVVGTEGEVLKAGLLPQGGRMIASLMQDDNLPSSREYFADVLDSIGVPSASRAYAQGTGYQAMSTFLPIWKAFRNLAYTLYIIMFVVVGIMIMLRTKVNAQTVITIQAALPNLLITLILITFSYAIVGFMIDLMYFLIYFVVYLVSSTGLINGPTKAIDRMLSYSAWSIIFEGRNSIISAASVAIGEVLNGLGTGALEVAGTILRWISFPYLVVAVYLAIQMIKLMFALIKSYVMLIVQTITAPVQILFNAMPGSKAFSQWLKTTASYLLPFPVAAAMFILAAVFIGDPTRATILEHLDWRDTNPFGINGSHEFYSNGDQKIWLPPFTLTGSVDFSQDDVMVLIGFFIFTMTPSVVKMTQEWLQVKESPYASEAIGGIGGFMLAPAKGLYGMVERRKHLEEQRGIYEKAVGGAQTGAPTRQVG